MATSDSRGSPENNSFGDRIDLGNQSELEINGNFDGATEQSGQPKDLGAAVWWSWIAPEDGTLRVVRTQGDAILFTGNSLDELQPVDRLFNYPAYYSLVESGTNYIVAGVPSPRNSEIDLQFKLITLPNDNFSDRIHLGSESTFDIEAPISHATFEPDERRNPWDIGSLWWSWTAPYAARVSFDVGRRDSSFTLYEGNSLGDLTRLVGASRTGRWETSVEQGHTYQISGSSSRTLLGEPFRLAMTSTRIIEGNDFIATAVNIGSLEEIDILGRTHGATLEEGEPDHGGRPDQRTVWFRWQSPATRKAFLSLVGDGRSSIDVRAYSENLEPLPGERSFDAIKGQSYLIVVLSPSELIFELRLDMRPENEFFDARTALGATSEVDIELRIDRARLEAGEPNHSRRMNKDWGSVWWTWTAPETIWYKAEAVVKGPPPSDMAIYTGDGLSTLQLVAKTDGLSYTLFRAEAGNDYEIALGKLVSERWPTAQVRLTPLPPSPENDNFADRIDLGNAPFLDRPFTNAGATLEAGEQEIVPSPLGQYGSVWWTWTPKYSSNAQVTVEGAPGGNIAIYEGEQLQNLIHVGDFREGTFFAQEGKRYEIAAYSPGPFSFTSGVLRLQQSYPAIANVLFENAVELGNAALLQTSAPVLAEPVNLPESAPRGPENAFENSSWWQWEPPGSSAFVGVSTPGNASLTLRVFKGSDLQSLELIGEDSGQAPAVFLTSRFKGEPVYIAVSGHIHSFFAANPRFTYDLHVASPPPPLNDSIFSALALASEATVTVASHNIGATQEGNELAASVWFNWRAPANGVYYITSGPFVPLISVFTGDDPRTLNSITDGEYSVSFTAEAGVEYRIAVGSANHGIIDFEIGEIGAALTNDKFDQRAMLTGNSLTVSGHNYGATRESTDPGYRNGPLPNRSHSVWWEWTAPNTGLTTIDYTDTEASMVFGVFTGVPGEFADAVLGRPGNQVTFFADSGKRYQIVAVSEAFEPGSFNFSLYQKVLPPTRDRFADRVILGDSEHVVTGENFIQHAPDAAERLVSRTLWWEWTSPSDGFAELLWYHQPTTSPVDRIRTFPDVWTGKLLPAGGTRVANNDSSFAVIKGTTYYLAYRFFETKYYRSRMGLEVKTTSAPNDLFANAIDLGVTDSVKVSSNLASATLEPDEPEDAARPKKSLWWKWSPQTSGLTRYFSIDARMAVYTGDSLMTLSQLPANGISLVETTADTDYWIRVVEERRQHLTGTPPEMDFSFEISRPNKAVNDMFVDRIVVENPVTSVEGELFGATAELGEPIPPHISVPNPASIWWEWIAPENATVVLRKSSATPRSTPVSVFVGENFDALIEVITDTVNDRFSAIEGTHYFMRAWSAPSGASLAWTLDLLPDPPTNDNFSDATRLNGPDVRLEGVRLSGSAREPCEPTHAENFVPNRTVWFTWTSPGEGVAQLSLSEEYSIVNAVVYTGDSIHRLTRVSSTGLFDASPGEVFHIAIASWNDALPDLSLKLLPPPENDAFAQAFDLGSAPYAAIDGTTLSATVETNEPSDGHQSRRRSVWYRWKPASDTMTVVKPVDPTAAEDDPLPRIEIYTGSEIGSLVRVPTAGAPGFHLSSGPPLFWPTPGKSYHIAVVGDEQGWPFRLTLGQATDPENDSFSGALDMGLVSGAASRSGFSGHAIRNSDPRTADQHATWWKFEVDREGVVHLESYPEYQHLDPCEGLPWTIPSRSRSGRLSNRRNAGRAFSRKTRPHLLCRAQHL